LEKKSAIFMSREVCARKYLSHCKEGVLKYKSSHVLPRIFTAASSPPVKEQLAVPSLK